MLSGKLIWDIVQDVFLSIFGRASVERHRLQRLSDKI